MSTVSQPALFDGAPARVAGLDDIADPDFLDLRKIIEDHPALSGRVAWEQANDLALQIRERAVRPAADLERQVEEMVKAWDKALSHGVLPDQHLIDACPNWVLERLGRRRVAA